MEPLDGILYIAEIFYETGELQFRYCRKPSPDGTHWIRDGRFTAYYPNGQLASEGLYDDDQEDGYWRDYHENGQLAAEGFYDHGQETGLWRVYDEAGQLEAEENYA